MNLATESVWEVGLVFWEPRIIKLYTSDSKHMRKHLKLNNNLLVIVAD